MTIKGLSNVQFQTLGDMFGAFAIIKYFYLRQTFLNFKVD